MTVTGVIDYDPVHRVSQKKEYAIKRTHMIQGLQLLLKTLPHSPPHQHKLKGTIAEYMEHPSQYLATTRKRVSEETVDKVYKQLVWCAERADVHPVFTEIAKWLESLEDKFCRTKTHPWTAIVRLPNEIVYPYQQELRNRGITITPSAWGAHVTWVKRERPTPEGEILWGWWQDHSVDMKITSELTRGGRGYWWLDISCPTLTQFRKELGLNPKPRVPLHITIGKEVR